MELIDKRVIAQDKKVVKLSPDDNMYMEGFAQRVFAKADKQDRAGRADL
jgi:vacuolar protein sorting-associated protein VTA1